MPVFLVAATRLEVESPGDASEMVPASLLRSLPLLLVLGPLVSLMLLLALALPSLIVLLLVLLLPFLLRALGGVLATEAEAPRSGVDDARAVKAAGLCLKRLFVAGAALRLLTFCF